MDGNKSKLSPKNFKLHSKQTTCRRKTKQGKTKIQVDCNRSHDRLTSPVDSTSYLHLTSVYELFCQQVVTKLLRFYPHDKRPGEFLEQQPLRQTQTKKSTERPFVTDGKSAWTQTDCCSHADVSLPSMEEDWTMIRRQGSQHAEYGHCICGAIPRRRPLLTGSLTPAGLNRQNLMCCLRIMFNTLFPMYYTVILIM